MYTLKLKHHFAAAHQLTNAFDEKCNLSIHGHNWSVIIEIKTKRLINNMVLDFKQIKEVVNEFDHKNLNDIISEEPTAENIARILWDKIWLLETTIDNEPRFEALSIEVFEAEGASIKYNGEE